MQEHRHIGAPRRARLFRLAAALLLGAAAIGIAVRLIAVPQPPPMTIPVGAGALDDALKAILVRCNQLGSKALDEAACRAAWVSNRRRFLRRPQKPLRSGEAIGAPSAMGPR